MRSCSTLLLVSVLSVGVAPSAHAQTPPLPQPYSATVSMPGGAVPMTVKLARDGSKEYVEQVVPKSANGPGMRLHLLYDFAAHKLWTVNLDGGPCSVVTYTSPALPALLDPISGSEEIRAGLAREKPVVLRSEPINGIATKVYEIPMPEIKGKMRLFLEEKQSFPVKMVMIPADGREQPYLELTNLSFAKPPANLFVRLKA